MIYLWCSSCSSRQCSSESSHRVQRLISYRVDFMLGGRYGKRIRKLFPDKKSAEAYEYITLADFKRGLFLPGEKSKIILKDFFNEYYEKYICRYMKAGKIEEYRLRPFRLMFDSRPIHTIQTRDIDKYIGKRLQIVGQTTINRELTSLMSMFKWAISNSYLQESPCKGIKKFKIETVRVRWLDDKEVNNILTACTEAKDLDLRDILVFALNTGFRKANLERITAHDIVNDRVQATRTKSGKAYEVPINRELGLLLERLRSRCPSGPLLNFKNFRRRFDSVVIDSTVTLHTLRHTFAAQCLKRGIPIDRVCAWLGHHSMEFTRSHYGHLAPNQEKIEINLLNLGGSIYGSNGTGEIKNLGKQGQESETESHGHQ